MAKRPATPSGSDTASSSPSRSWSSSPSRSASSCSRSRSPPPPKRSPAGTVKRGRSPPPAKQASPRPRIASPAPESVVLHVDQLTRNVNEAHLKEIFSVVIMTDKGKSKVTDDIDRAQWSDGMRKCLIDICLEQVKSGGRPGIQFSSEAWKMIIEKFTQRTGHSFNQKQLKNQLDNLKKLYNAWLHLTSQTGIGFNPHTGCVEMEQDRRTEYLKTHRDAKVFKSKPLPFPEEMAALFDGTSARGDDKWAPTMDGVPEDITTDVDSSFFNLDHYDETPSPNLTNSRSSTLPEDSMASDIASDVMMANIRRKRPRPSKKQSIASNDAINACIIDLAASVKASTQLVVPLVQSEGPTIDDCIDVLHAMPEISEASPLYLIALTCFMVKDKRTIWMRFRTDEGKMAWLKHQLQLEKGNTYGSDSGL